MPLEMQTPDLLHEIPSGRFVSECNWCNDWRCFANHSSCRIESTDQVKETAQIVKSGTWLYDGQVVHEVWIVKQNFDFYYDEGFEDAPENLNEDGEIFQVVVAQDGKVKSVGLAFHSTEEAVAKAHQIIPQGIVWDNHRLQPLFHGRRYRLAE